jgi:hypothetical protein
VSGGGGVTWVCKRGRIRMTHMSHTMHTYPFTRVHTTFQVGPSCHHVKSCDVS